MVAQLMPTPSGCSSAKPTVQKMSLVSNISAAEPRARRRPVAHRQLCAGRSAPLKFTTMFYTITIGVVRSGTMHVSHAKIENRTERRLKVFLRVEMKMKSHCHPAHLLDVSPNGAQVYCKFPIEIGAFVLLQYPGISCQARCVRAQARRIGLKFVSPLLPSQLGLLISAR